MTDIEKIESSVEIRKELSELLNEKIKVVECWHRCRLENAFVCQKCGQRSQDYYKIDCENPNLFDSEGIGFFKVWRAVKDREDWLKANTPIRMDGLIHKKEIASPHFQLSVLKWLYQDDIGRVEKVLEKGKEE
ncbi:MAG: hypothetical protein KAJ07_00305 [Planctomycetes bacterium]|nr:hypothetical protein [Planctomycetota bacterium]